MRNRFDQFVKDVLRQGFDLLGTSHREMEVVADAQRMDFFFVPGSSDASQGSVAALPSLPPPLFVRMASTSCVIEHYSRAPDLEDLRGCLRKQLTWHHVRSRGVARATSGLRAPVAAARAPSPSITPVRGPGPAPSRTGRRATARTVRDPVSPAAPENKLRSAGPERTPAMATKPSVPAPMAILWTLSASRSAEVVKGFAFEPLDGWPVGFYAGPLSAVPFRLVVLSELPEDRVTLPLRLLGRGATLRRAARDLAALPPDAWEQQHIRPLLVRLHVEIQEAQRKPVLTEEEKELMVTAQEFVKNLEENAIKRGQQQGHQLLMHQFARRLGRPVSEEERAVLRTRFDALGPDRLGDVVFDFDAAALASWLADPSAR